MIDYATFMAKTEIEKEDYEKVTMEFVSLSMEQLNQMWSYLGSKYMPSALYKMRLCTIQNTPTVSERVVKKIAFRSGSRKINCRKKNLWENNPHNPIGLLESNEFES